MEFCPKCGAILVMKKKRFGCPRCNYTAKGKIKIQTSEKVDEKNSVNVIKKKQVEALPVIDFECKKCKNKKAYFWTRESTEEGEGEEEFYKCTKCNHVVRGED